MGRRRKIVFNVAEDESSKGAKAGESQTANEQKLAFDPQELEREFREILDYRRKQKNNLLGAFEGENYVIPQKMKDELIRLPKIFDHFEGNVMYASIKLGRFVLNFKIEMDIGTEFCKARLYIIEMEQAVEDDVKHVTLLDEIVEVWSARFREHFEQKWNIVFDEQSAEHDDVVQRYLENQSDEFYFNRELVEILSQLYLLRMLAHLAGMGELGEKMTAEYKLLMDARLKNNPGFAQDFALQKELLDYVLMKNGALAMILSTPEGQNIIRGYYLPIKNVRDKTYPSILTEANLPKSVLEAKKPAAKDVEAPKKKEEEASPSKSKSKSSSGGGGKKKSSDDSGGGKKKKSSGGGGGAGVVKKKNQQPAKPANNPPTNFAAAKNAPVEEADQGEAILNALNEELIEEASNAAEEQKLNDVGEEINKEGNDSGGKNEAEDLDEEIKDEQDKTAENEKFPKEEHDGKEKTEEPVNKKKDEPEHVKGK